jgi:Protein of unknown function (DUF3987)
VATYHQRRDKPLILKASDDALAIIQTFASTLALRHDELADLSPFAARWVEWAWRQAVVLHAAKHGAQAHEHLLEEDTMRAAVGLTVWFSNQQLSILEKSRMAARKEKEQAVFHLFLNPPAKRPKGAPLGSLTAREIQQAHIVDSAAEARALLQQMEEAGKLTSQEDRPPHGGHPVRYYFRVS